MTVFFKLWPCSRSSKLCPYKGEGTVDRVTVVYLTSMLYNQRLMYGECTISPKLFETVTLVLDLKELLNNPYGSVMDYLLDVFKDSLFFEFY